MASQWMIYGAYGYTGRRIAEEAVSRGHSPLLAGRSEEKLAPVAVSLELDGVAIDLHDQDRLVNYLGNVDLVVNAAGPFVHTALPLAGACLETGTNYLDVAGEVMVFEQLLALDRQAQEKQIALIPGVGFNVLASDCLARYVAEKIEDAAHLEIATQWMTQGISLGSTKTMIESFPLGTLARRGGQLVRINARAGLRQQRFRDGVDTILPVTLGDLATAYKTTQIPDITTFTALSEGMASFYGRTEPIFRRLYSFSFFRQLASKGAEVASTRSEQRHPESNTAQVWVMVRNEARSERQAWLETVDSYKFTAEAAVRSVESVLADHPVGALTPALAFGADFVLEIPGTKRFDSLEAF